MTRVIFVLMVAASMGATTVSSGHSSFATRSAVSSVASAVSTVEAQPAPTIVAIKQLYIQKPKCKAWKICRSEEQDVHSPV